MKNSDFKYFLLALALNFILVIAADEVRLVNLDEPIRVKGFPNEFTTFKIDRLQLKPSTEYNVKVSWIGSVGIEIRIYWKSDIEDEITKKLFKPLDTEKLDFTTDSNGNIQGTSVQSRIEKTDFYQFSVVGYRNTRARDLEAKKQPFEYFLKLEEVVVNGAPQYVLKQFGLVIFLTFVLVILLSRSYYAKNGYLNNLFSPSSNEGKNK